MTRDRAIPMGSGIAVSSEAPEDASDPDTFDCDKSNGAAPLERPAPDSREVIS